MTVRLAVLQDATDLGASLALAYLCNPLVRWMFEDDLSETRLQRLFTSLVEFGVKNGQVFTSTTGGVAAIWFPPIPELGSSDVTTDSSEWSGGRRDALLAALAAARPTERHYYLDTVGVVPTKRRRGTASALLAPVLATCDSDGIRAFLENSDSANTSFYRGLGFEEIESLRLPTGAPRVVSMLRTPS